MADAEVVFDGVGTPVSRPLVSTSGAEFVLDGQGPPEISPTVGVLGTAGVPVGAGNRPDFPVSFDNQGKNVVVVPVSGPPGGNATTVSFPGPSISVSP